MGIYIYLLYAVYGQSPSITLHLYKLAMDFVGGKYLGWRQRSTLRKSSWGQFFQYRSLCISTCPMNGVETTDSCATCSLLPLQKVLPRIAK